MSSNKAPNVGIRARAVRFFLLCAATLPASLPLVRDGFFSSSDGMIHLYRVFELDRALRAGIFFPRWFPLSGYGYGLPVLNYYPPLMYYFAEFFNLLGAGYIGSVKLVIAFTFIVAACSMFLFTRELLGDTAAFVASIAFVYLPYFLSDAYIRGNFPEMLAMSLIPLALYAFQRVFAAPSLPTLILAAISFALIILTHHLTAMLAAPLIGAFILFLFLVDLTAHTPTSAYGDGMGAVTANFRKLFLCLAAISLSLLLSAFYWVPAITELNLVFVGPASLARFLVSRLVTLEQFFAPSLVYTYVPQSDALQHSAGYPQTVAALVAGAIVVVSVRAKKSPLTPPLQRGAGGIQYHALFHSGLLITSLFMMLNLSAPLWYAIPTLRFMQFPWRFQILAGISIASLIGVGAKSIGQMANGRWRIISQSLLSLALIFLALANLPDRSIPLTNAQVDLTRSADPDYVVAQMGWSWTREFAPAAVQEENVVGPKQRAGAPPAARVVPQVRIENDGLLSRTLRVIATEPTEISLHQFYFPGWQAYIDGAMVSSYPSGSLGLVTATVPQGEHRVEFRFGETLYRTAMDLISAFAFLGIAAWLFIKKRRAFFALVIAIIFLGAIVGLRMRTALAAQPIALSNRFDDNATLIGYSTERTNDALFVTLEWLALREMKEDFIVTVQLLDANGKIAAQSDMLTDWGVTPTSHWQRGELVTDRRVLPNVPRGSYRLIAGMYLPKENGFDNVAVYDQAGKMMGNQVELGSIEIQN